VPHYNVILYIYSSLVTFIFLMFSIDSCFTYILHVFLNLFYKTSHLTGSSIILEHLFANDLCICA